MRKIVRGFTLIELLIVTAVIAILLAIALPSYSAYIQRANRAHAKAALLRAALWMERVATARGRYPTMLAAGLEAVEGKRYAVCLVGGTPAASVTLPAPHCPAPVPSSDGTPSLLPAATETEFALVAYPIDSAGNAHDKCGAFTVTHAGARGLLINGTPSADASLLAECWNK